MRWPELAGFFRLSANADSATLLGLGYCEKSYRGYWRLLFNTSFTSLNETQTWRSPPSYCLITFDTTFHHEDTCRQRQNWLLQTTPCVYRSKNTCDLDRVGCVAIK